MSGSTAIDGQRNLYEGLKAKFDVWGNSTQTAIGTIAKVEASKTDDLYSVVTVEHLAVSGGEQRVGVPLPKDAFDKVAARYQEGDGIMDLTQRGVTGLIIRAPKRSAVTPFVAPANDL